MEKNTSAYAALRDIPGHSALGAPWRLCHERDAAVTLASHLVHYCDIVRHGTHGACKRGMDSSLCGNGDMGEQHESDGSTCVRVCQCRGRGPDSPPDMVGGCLVCFQGVSGCRPGVTHDMIGHRTGSRVPSLRVSAAVRCQLWLFSGRRRHGPAWQLGRVAYKPMLQAGSPYARYGSAASANILCRALSSNSYEGWPRARRMINLLA